MLMPRRSYASATGYRYGFNGKENDNEPKGLGNQQDYGMRGYDPRIGRFYSEDPLSSLYPHYSPYQYAGNNPIKYVDLDGTEEHDNTIERFWKNQPQIDMTKAPAGSAVNSAGYPRNGIWFMKQLMAQKPEMFSQAAQNSIRVLNRMPVIDEQWIKFNPSHSEYIGQQLQHHHINGGEMAVAIPKGAHFDFFSELHSYLNPKEGKFSGARIAGRLGGTLNMLGGLSMLSGAFSGNPDAWINAFSGGEPTVGDIKKDWGSSNLYIEIMAVSISYTPLLDKNGDAVIDKATGKAKQRIATKVVTANMYSDFIYDDEEKRYKGINKIESKTEKWDYNEKGDRIKERTVEKS